MAKPVIITCAPTGGGLGMTREERLRAALRASPEMASLNVGSMNFGIFPLLEKYKTFQHDWEQPFLEMTRDFIFRNDTAAPGMRLINGRRRHRRRPVGPCAGCRHGVRHATGAPG